MIGNASNDYDMRELILSSIYKVEVEIKRFWRKNKASNYLNEQLEKCKLSKVQDVDEAIKEYFFPNIVGYKQKAMFLGYMVNCLVSSYFGQRPIENKDESKNKRVKLVGELLDRQV